MAQYARRKRIHKADEKLLQLDWVQLILKRKSNEKQKHCISWRSNCHSKQRHSHQFTCKKNKRATAEALRWQRPWLSPLCSSSSSAASLVAARPQTLHHAWSELHFWKDLQWLQKLCMKHSCSSWQTGMLRHQRLLRAFYWQTTACKYNNLVPHNPSLSSCTRTHEDVEESELVQKGLVYKQSQSASRKIP